MICGVWKKDIRMICGRLYKDARMICGVFHKARRIAPQNRRYGISMAILDTSELLTPTDAHGIKLAERIYATEL